MKPLTPDAAGRELARVLTTAAKVRADLAAHTKTVKGRLSALEERATELAAIANGDPVQVEIDTTEATLREAGRVAKRKGGES